MKVYNMPGWSEQLRKKGVRDMHATILQAMDITGIYRGEKRGNPPCTRAFFLSH